MGACTGVIGGGGQSDNGDDPRLDWHEGKDPGFAPVVGEPEQPREVRPLAPARIWRLSPSQIEHTLSVAFGTTMRLPDIAPRDRYEGLQNPSSGGFEADAAFMQSWEALVMSRAPELGLALGRQLACQGGLDADCLRAGLPRVLRALWRQSQPESTPFVSLFEHLQNGPESVTAERALQGVAAALLLSPQFLFRTELGSGEARGGVVVLAPDELASALSYALWNAPPDDELLEAAADGSLLRPEVRAGQIERMMQSPRGQDGALAFLIDWLGMGAWEGVEKSAMLFPSWTEATKLDVFGGLLASLRRRLQDDGARYVDLIAHDSDLIPAASLAALYGVQETSADVPVSLPTERRAGVFTHPGVIAAMSEGALTGVVYRGKSLLNKLLCIEVEPPANVDFPDLDDVGTGGDATTRERLRTVEDLAACRTCHLLMHPFSFAMETYDAIGRYRQAENGRAIDASGRLTLSDGSELEFTGATELLRKLAAAQDSQACYTRHVLRYLAGSHAADENKALSAALVDHATEQELSTAAMFEWVAKSPEFTLRLREEEQ